MHESARQWWESFFPDSTGSGRGKLPDHVSTVGFWKEYFSPMLLVLDSIQNSDQFWKRTQKIFENITNATVPCPFSKTPHFINYLFDTKDSLNIETPNKAIGFLELVPNVADPEIILNKLPKFFQYHSSYLTLLHEMNTKKHWIWNHFLASDGSIDLLLDQLIPIQIINTPSPTQETIELSILSIKLVATLVTSKPGNIANFKREFNAFFTVLTDIIQNNDGSVAYYAAEACISLLESAGFTLTAPRVAFLSKKFTESLSHSSFKFVSLKRLLMVLNGDEACASTAIALITNPNCADDFLLANDFAARADGTATVSYVQQLIKIGANNKVFSALANTLISDSLKRSGDFEWITAFCKSTINFVISCQVQKILSRRVYMAIETLLSIHASGCPLASKAASEAAGMLLGSQRVPIAFLGCLKPGPSDRRQLAEVLKEKPSKQHLKTALSNVQVEASAKPPAPFGPREVRKRAPPPVRPQRKGRLPSARGPRDVRKNFGSVRPLHKCL